MNFDFHTHGKLSKKVDFSLEYFKKMIHSAKESGLNGFALTEHFNTHNFEDVYNTLDAHYSYTKNYYEVDGLKIFPGMEVDIREVGHILIIADRMDIRAMRMLLENYTSKEQFIPFAQLFELAAPFNPLIIGAHPYRKSTSLYELDPSLLQQLDAFDLNGKDLHSIGIEKNQELVYRFAEKLNKPVVGGSDTHHSLQYGCLWNQLNKECHTVKDLKKVISNGDYTIHIASDLDSRVKNATEQKAIEKKAMEKQQV